MRIPRPELEPGVTSRVNDGVWHLIEPPLKLLPAYAIGVYFPMVIKETSIFTKRVQKLLDRESYRLLQLRLVAEPDAGDPIRGTGGLRKVGWEGDGRGKRGGVRVIYYWARKQDVMLMLLIYGKNQQDDLTSEQKALLKKLIQEEYP